MIDLLIDADPILQHDDELLCSIKGIARRTSQWLLVLLHSHRFAHARELAAFVGLTPYHRQSATSLNTPGHLSGRGNPYLRTRLYMPALCAARHDPALRAFYQRLLDHGKRPKQAIVAVMRKLLHIAFGVIKHQTPYNPLYNT